ncbi:MAG: pyridoxamine 5'-phosphate oxidase family protein [Promethearchaeota archaeon]
MRRKEKEIIDIKEIESIIDRASVCRIGLSEDNLPYIIPMNFGYKNNFLYFHSTPVGKKIDIIKKNNNVCFELDIDHELLISGDICNSSMKYHSVIGFGKASFINNAEEKRKALNIITNHYLSKDSHEYNERLLEKITIIKIEIENMTGKKSGF